MKKKWKNRKNKLHNTQNKLTLITITIYWEEEKRNKLWMRAKMKNEIEIMANMEMEEKELK